MDRLETDVITVLALLLGTYCFNQDESRDPNDSDQDGASE